MVDRMLWRLAVLNLLLCFSMAGCTDARPLRIKKNPKLLEPWCGPKQRVQIGERVVGHVGMGENKWKIFLVDEAGKEHDPEKIADQVWSYLERTGEAKKIQDAFGTNATFCSMAVVSINPLVVILERSQDTGLRKHLGPAPDRSYWVAQIYTLRDPFDKEGLQWFSPELKQSPTDLRFSEGGVAEIPLPKGKLMLTRDAGTCKTTRE